MEQMYKGIPFSPTATLTGNISATDTIIPVSDVDAFPDAPNIATIGSIAGPNETIIYTGKTTTSLTGCTRGVEGAASDWMTDELIGRNFTAKDHADMVKNIEELENSKLDATYKVDVVNTADVSVAGKALDARQNNPNITGTLAQKVTSNTQRINDLFINYGTFSTFQNGYTGNTRAYKIGRFAFISIHATKTNFLEWEIICTLPIEIRPSNNRVTTPVGGGLGTYNNGVCFYVKTNGDLSSTSLPAAITEISGIAIFEL